MIKRIWDVVCDIWFALLVVASFAYLTFVWWCTCPFGRDKE